VGESNIEYWTLLFESNERKQAEAPWRRAKRNGEGFAHKPFVIDQLLN